MRAGLLLLALPAGCAPHRAPPEPGGAQAVELGWRLVPGQELRYAFRVELVEEGERVSREADWSWLVRSVDAGGSAVLEGHLAAFGVAAARQGRPVPQQRLAAARDSEEQRLSKVEARLALGPDGRVLRPAGPGWEDALPQRALGLALPPGPVRRGETWPDPFMGWPFRELLAPSMPVQVDIADRLAGFSGASIAIIETSGTVRGDGMAELELELRGETRWNLASGLLEHRRLEVVLLRGGLALGESLVIEVELQGGSGRAKAPPPGRRRGPSGRDGP